MERNVQIEENEGVWKKKSTKWFPTKKYEKKEEREEKKKERFKKINPVSKGRSQSQDVNKWEMRRGQKTNVKMNEKSKSNYGK